MKIEKRTENLKQVRSANKVPGVLYGRTIQPISIQLDEKELGDLLNKYGRTQTFNVKIEKESHQVYIKDIQKDIINKSHYLSFDFHKVESGDTISAKVPLHFIGKTVIQDNGYLVQVVDDAIEVEYPAGKKISHIEVDISHLSLHDVLHIKDVLLPVGIKLNDDENKVVVHIAERKHIIETVEEEPASTEMIEEEESTTEE